MDVSTAAKDVVEAALKLDPRVRAEVTEGRFGRVQAHGTEEGRL